MINVRIGDPRKKSIHLRQRFNLRFKQCIILHMKTSEALGKLVVQREHQASYAVLLLEPVKVKAANITILTTWQCNAHASTVQSQL